MRALSPILPARDKDSSTRQFELSNEAVWTILVDSALRRADFSLCLPLCRFPVSWRVMQCLLKSLYIIYYLYYNIYIII